MLQACSFGLSKILSLLLLNVGRTRRARFEDRPNVYKADMNRRVGLVSFFKTYYRPC